MYISIITSYYRDLRLERATKTDAPHCLRITLTKNHKELRNAFKSEKIPKTILLKDCIDFSVLNKFYFAGVRAKKELVGYSKRNKDDFFFTGRC